MLANLAILKGAVGTEQGCGILPLRGQNNVQGASDMGALPDLLPGYQHVTDADARRRVAAVWGVEPPAVPGHRIPALRRLADRLPGVASDVIEAIEGHEVHLRS